jgi:phage terminase large subunit-like protein
VTACDHRGALHVVGERVACSRCGKTLAWVDVLRAHPDPVGFLERLELELGPEAVGALETAWEFWRRPEQRFPTAEELRSFGIVIFAGEYGTGKTRTAWEYLVHLILTGVARGPRIIAMSGAAAREIVEHKLTGILAWRKPGVTYGWESSKGYEGELTVNAVTIALMSIEAPRSALGAGVDVQLLDDPPKWGPTGKAALVAALKSARERGALTVIPTTADGLVLVAEVLGVHVEDLADAGVLVIDLGSTDANAGNLGANYMRNRASLKRAGLWDPVASTSPWASIRFEDMRLATCPALVELAVSIDPNKDGASKPCEVGIVGGGRDARDILHVRYDKSDVLDGGVDGWPKVAWDLAEELHREHPRAPFPAFVFESNVGKHRADLLYAEERNRRKSRGEPGMNVNCKIEFVRADRDKCVRAEAPAKVAGHGQVKHATGLHVLEGQLRNLTPKGTDSDRADAANHLLTYLGKLETGAEQVEHNQAMAQAREAFAGFAQAQARMPKPAFGAPERGERDRDRGERII